jgi:diguanylate cyclase (GGDEF)-like protein
LTTSSNDGLGHHHGDDALRYIANMARERCRESDFVGRWGGDEYVFILPNTAIDGGMAFAHRLQAVLFDNPYVPAGRDAAWPMTISIGAADLACGPFERPGQLLEAADRALYRAKEAGRNRVISAGPSSVAA